MKSIESRSSQHQLSIDCGWVWSSENLQRLRWWEWWSMTPWPIWTLHPSLSVIQVFVLPPPSQHHPLKTIITYVELREILGCHTQFSTNYIVGVPLILLAFSCSHNGVTLVPSLTQWVMKAFPGYFMCISIKDQINSLLVNLSKSSHNPKKIWNG